MKKLIVAALLGLTALTAAPAQAGVRFGVTIGNNNAYSQPACRYYRTYNGIVRRCSYNGYSGYNNGYGAYSPYQNGYGYQNTYGNGYDYNRAQQDYNRRLREYQHQRWHQENDNNDEGD
jgi:hypothetical protein